jgi:hypothetical protein
MRLFCVCVVLYVGSGLATDLSLVQGVIPSVKMITELKKRPGPCKSHLKKKKSGVSDVTWTEWLDQGISLRAKYAADRVGQSY